MFVWTEELGVKPINWQNGSFNGRETRFAVCSCGAGNSYYVDTGELCDEQSAALHAEAHGFESVEELNRAIEAAEAAEATIDSLVIDMILAAMSQGELVVGVFISAAPSDDGTDDDTEIDWSDDDTEFDWQNGAFGEGPLN